MFSEELKVNFLMNRQLLERLPPTRSVWQRRDKSMSALFVKVLDIVSEQLSVELDKVNLTSHICNDSGANPLNPFIFADY